MVRKVKRRKRTDMDDAERAARSAEEAFDRGVQFEVMDPGDPVWRGRDSKIKVFNDGMFDGAAHSVGVGLDPGSANVAFTAVGDHDHGYGWHVHPNDSKGVDRLIQIEDALTAFMGLLALNGCRVEHVCIEGYAHGMKFGVAEMGEATGTLKRTLRKIMPVPVAYPTVVATTALKKFCSGSGAGSKGDVKLAIYKKWDADISNEHIADAYVLARIARAVHSPDTATLAYERDVLSKLTEHTEWHNRPPQTST